MSAVRPWMKTTLWAMVAVTLAASAWRGIGSTESEDPADLVAERGDRKPGASKAEPAAMVATAGQPAASGADPGRPVRLTSRQPAIDIFKTHRWFVEPPPPPPPAPVVATVAPVVAPPAPTMPPPPFVIIGRIDTGTEAPKVFINHRESLQVIGVGDVVDANFRIDTISSNAMTMTYLPTQQAVTLPVAGIPR